MTTADSSEPKSIDYIRSKNVRIEGALKGADSINTGIDFLLEYEIIVNAHLVEFMTEFDNYSWGVDKKTNKPTNKKNKQLKGKLIEYLPVHDLFW